MLSAYVSDWVAVVLRGPKLVLNHPWLALCAFLHRRYQLTLAVLDSISVLMVQVYAYLVRSFSSCGSRSGGTLFSHGLAYGDTEI